MRIMKRVGCILLCLCMIFSLLPLGTMAEDSLCSTCLTDPCGCLPQCTGDETCTLTEGHKEGCPKTCGGYEGCHDGVHSEDCVLFVCPECEGKAGNHTDTCPTRCTGGESCANGHVSPCPLTPAEFDPPQPRGGETLTFTLCRANGTDFGSNSMPYVDRDPARMRIRVSDGSYATMSQISTDPAANVTITEEADHVLLFSIASPQPNTSYAIYYKATEESQAVATGLSLFVMTSEEEDPPAGTPGFVLCNANGDEQDFMSMPATVAEVGAMLRIKKDGVFLTCDQIVCKPSDTVSVTGGGENSPLVFNITAANTYNIFYTDGNSETNTGISLVAEAPAAIPDFRVFAPNGSEVPFTQIEAYLEEGTLIGIRLADDTPVTASQIVIEPSENISVSDHGNGYLLFSISATGTYKLLYKEASNSEPIDTGLSILATSLAQLFYDIEANQIHPNARVRLEAGSSTTIGIRFTSDGTYESSSLVDADLLTPSAGSGITVAPGENGKTTITAGDTAGDFTISYAHPNTQVTYSVPVTVLAKGAFSFFLDGNPFLHPSIEIPTGASVSMSIRHNLSDSYVTTSQLQVSPADGITVTAGEGNVLCLTAAKAGTYQLSYKADASAEPVSMEFSVTVEELPPFTFYDPWGHEFDDLGAMANPHPFGEPLGIKIKHTASGKYLIPKQIVTDEGSSITVSDSTEFADVVDIRFSSIGTYNLYYKETETSEPVWFGTVEVAPVSAGIVEGQMIPGALIARGANLGNGNFNAACMQPGKSYEVMFAILGQNGTLTPVNPDLIWSTSDMLKIETVDAEESICKITVLSGGNGYFRTENAKAPFHAYTYGAEAESFLDDQEGLLASEDGSNFVPTLTLAVNEEVTVSLRYGSTGASVPVTSLSNSAVKPNGKISLTANNDGTFTLKGLKTGSASISYKNASGDNGLPITVVQAKAENKHLFVTGGHSGYSTYLGMAPGESRTWKFYFGTFSESEAVDVQASGNVTVQKDADGYLVTAGAAGNGLIWYEKGGIAYTMPVMIAATNHESNTQPSNTAVINGITYTTARLDGETLEVMPNFGQDYTENSTMDFAQSIVLAAMRDGSLASGAFSNISDLSASFIYCVDDKDETKPSNNARMSIISAKVPSTDITTSGVTVQAEATKGFRSIIALSFTVADPQDPMPRRITLQCPMAYNIRGGDVTITISQQSELNTAAELNVVLSSYEAFLNWLEDPGDGVTVSGKFALGGNIVLNLPDIAYTDGIVVAQMVSDINNSGRPVSSILLSGHGTTMAGLVSKGGLNAVNGISFVADENLTMTHLSETFTCGILGTYIYNGANAPFDAAYAARYCTDGAPTTMAAALMHSTEKISVYPLDLKWGSCTIYDLDNCSFEGYDYGVRSTSTGVVGGGSGCSFSYCHYGIYMDSNGFGVSAGNPHNVDYSGYKFLNNKYAVCLVSLPGGATPYVFRIHDSDFDHNHFDFHLTPTGDYYFYRNYFGGYWRKHDHHGRWQCFHGQHNFNLDAEEQQHKNNKNEGHRAYRAIEDAGVRIFATLSRDRETNSGYHLYHNRLNRYLKGNGTMPVSANSIGNLPQRTELEIASESNGSVTVEASFIMGGGRNS